MNERRQIENERIFWYNEASRIHDQFMNCDDLDSMQRLNKQHQLAQSRHLRACLEQLRISLLEE